MVLVTAREKHEDGAFIGNSAPDAVELGGRAHFLCHRVDACPLTVKCFLHQVLRLGTEYLLVSLEDCLLLVSIEQ